MRKSLLGIFLVEVAPFIFSAERFPISPIADEENVKRMVFQGQLQDQHKAFAGPSSIKPAVVGKQLAVEHPPVDQFRLGVYDPRISIDEIKRRISSMDHEHALSVRINGRVISKKEKKERARASTDLFAAFCYKKLSQECPSKELEEKGQKLMGLRAQLSCVVGEKGFKGELFKGLSEHLQSLIHELNCYFIEQYSLRKYQLPRDSSRSSSSPA